MAGKFILHHNDVVSWLKSLCTEETLSRQLSEAWLDQEREMIEEFFNTKVPQVLSKTSRSEQSKCNAESCDQFAKKLLESDNIRPVDSQGAASYTLICKSQNKIVQFRLEPLEEDVLKLAYTIYGELVPLPIFTPGFQLPVYVCPVIPGIVHMLQSFPDDDFPLQRQLTTVRDLAMFVAKAAFWPQPRDSLRSNSWTTTAKEKLKSIANMECLRQWEPRFAQKAKDLSEKLYLLEKLPVVLTHLDFAEVNIMVNPSNGHLTGVLDFDGARNEAFGMCLFGIYEGFFGVMRDMKWEYFNQPASREVNRSQDDPPKTIREVLESAFWDTLWDSLPSWMAREDLEASIIVALEVGIVNRYFDSDRDVDAKNDSDIRLVNWATGLLFDR